MQFSIAGTKAIGHGWNVDSFAHRGTDFVLGLKQKFTSPLHLHTSHVHPVIRCHSRYLVSQLPLPSLPPRHRMERTPFIGKDLPKAISLCEHLKSRRGERERERFLDHFLFFSFFPSPHFYRAIEAVSSRLEYEKMETKRLTAASRFNYRDEWTITSKFSLEVGYYVYIYACVWDICGSLSHILAKKIEISIYIYSGSCQESETRFVERTLMKMIFDVF